MPEREIKCPRQLTKLPPAPTFDSLAIVLGKDQRGAAVILPQRPRMEHMHCIGTTGGGKSKFLEHALGVTARRAEIPQRRASQLRPRHLSLPVRSRTRSSGGP